MQIKTALLVGGSNSKDDKKLLSQNPQVVVGSPSKVFDLMDHNEFNFNGLKICILDEADELL